MLNSALDVRSSLTHVDLTIVFLRYHLEFRFYGLKHGYFGSAPSIHHFVTLSILNRVVSALLFICLSEKHYGCTMDHSVMHASTC